MFTFTREGRATPLYSKVLRAALAGGDTIYKTLKE